MRRFIALATLVVAACGGTGVDAFPMIVSSQGTVGTGQQRVLVALLDPATDTFLGSEDTTVTATLRDGIGSPISQHEGSFVSFGHDDRGLYSFQMEIPGPGTFQLTFDSPELGESGPVGLVTVDDPMVIGPGDPAPRSVTRTGAEHPLSDISSDPDPDPSFYELTIAEAVEQGPSVIVFSTPAWCTTATCGPMLEQVKALSTEFPELNYVHVEIYQDIHVTSETELVVVPAVDEWLLPSEPWVFVTDSGGVVAAAFEGAVTDEELARAFAAVGG